MTPLVCVVVAAVVVTLGAAPPAFAQPGGQLEGVIADQTGAALPGVLVTLRGPDRREGQSDEAGHISFRDLPDGDYVLQAALEGFEALRRNVRVQAGATTTVTLTLVVAFSARTEVTAAKTGARDPQTLGMAVTAVPAADLTRLSSPTIDQAVAAMPAVTFTQNGSFGQLSIRGIGTNAVNAGADPSSAMYLDGVYLARPAMALIDFLDLDRVEVLRGPRGTLYGRNAVGGALNLISRPPSEHFEATARLTAGNFDALRVEARASGPLVRDRLIGSVAFARGVRDGYVRDLEHPDHPLGGEDVVAARGHLEVRFDDRTTLRLSSDVTDQKGTLLTFNKILQVKPGFVVDNPAGLHEVRASSPASSRLLQAGGAARLTSTLTPSMVLTSLTAYRQLDNAFVVDADISEVPLLVTHNHERQHQISEELTLSGRHGRMTFVGGLFAFYEADDQRLLVDQLASRSQVQLLPRVEAASGAFYGEATVALTPRASIVGGLRYSRERKTIDNAGGRYAADPPASAFPGSEYAYTDAISYRAWTPKLAVEVTLSDGRLAYASATRGFKSGGFNLSSTEPGRAFAPEWVWSYEAGVKSPVLGGRGWANATAFHMNYTDLQVQTPIGIGVFDIRNAAAATIRGVELEGAVRIGPGLHAGGHLVWLDAIYDRYIAVGIGGVIGDVAGRRLNNAPEWAGRLWAEWTGRVGIVPRVSLVGDATAQSTVFHTPFNDTIQRQLPYGLLGARAEVGPASRRWAINVFGRNLTDTGYIMATFGTAPTAFGGRPALPREVGIELVIQR